MTRPLFQQSERRAPASQAQRAGNASERTYAAYCAHRCAATRRAWHDAHAAHMAALQAWSGEGL